jgi:hypothetical protein
VGGSSLRLLNGDRGPSEDLRSEMDAVEWILTEDALLMHLNESGINLHSVMKAPGPLTSKVRAS